MNEKFQAIMKANGFESYAQSGKVYVWRYAGQWTGLLFHGEQP